jgi:hypothetical protein
VPHHVNTKEDEEGMKEAEDKEEIMMMEKKHNRKVKKK